MTNNDSLWADLQSNLERSQYQPYKLLFTPSGDAIRLLKVNVKGKAFAACPEYNLIEQAEGILDAWFQLAPRLQAALGLPSETVFSQTCTAPFLVEVKDQPLPTTSHESSEPEISARPVDEEQLTLF
jgi:hypothetical protein